MSLSLRRPLQHTVASLATLRTAAALPSSSSSSSSSAALREQEQQRPRASGLCPGQVRTAVFSAAPTPKASGPFQALREEVAERFRAESRGRPRTITAAQFVKLAFEVGAVPKTAEVPDVVNRLMLSGFYSMTHPNKRDSYGPIETPSLGLEECQRWAAALLLDTLKEEEVKSQTGRSN
eukprot:CAMPEP_0206580972 /NCGR_PEP_ID=MMETSP0325_2-20121206/33517_1 /ASSEMBLY_ACC=CAM_ASM_000347 /TAXON_ID=2866 /ORGANISM="Crypthecodinium cohnii, Strain Seligo" /LENGTH=178 /DNA_ID=CAMNT_0054087185 /DNA_START=96 /DNA_END=632 /DNA_ORIENTATION=+